MPKRIGNLELVRRVGEAVHGPYWQKPLADDLGVNRRTINRWISRISPVPDTMQDGTPLAESLLAIIETHEKQLAAAKILVLRRMKETVVQAG